MNFFERKIRYYIIVDEVTNFKVQRFAERYCVSDSPITVASYCDLVVVAFDTYKTRDVIFEKLMKEFGTEFNIEKRTTIVSVTKKES